MQLQAAGAGLPTSIAAGLPPGFLQPNNAAAAAAAAAGLPGIPPGFLTGGLPPASIAAQMAIESWEDSVLLLASMHQGLDAARMRQANANAASETIEAKMQHAH